MANPDYLLAIEEEINEFNTSYKEQGYSLHTLLEFLDIIGYFAPTVFKQFKPTTSVMAQAYRLYTPLLFVSDVTPFFKVLFAFHRALLGQYDDSDGVLTKSVHEVIRAWQDKNALKGRTPVPMEEISDVLDTLLYLDDPMDFETLTSGRS